MSSQDLIVQPKGQAPSMPVVLLDSKFISALATIEAQAQSLVVDTKEDADKAGALLVRAQNADKALEDNRQQVKKPFLEMGKAIDAAARKEAERITKIKSTIKRRIMDWNAKEQARLQAEEEARQAELRRLQEEKRRQDEEAAKAAKAAETIEMDFDSLEIEMEMPKTEIEKKIEDLQFGQQLSKPEAPSGIHYRTYLKWEVVDVNQVPDVFIVREINRAEINRVLCNGYKDGDPIPNVPGLKFEVVKQPIARSTKDETVLF